MSLSTENVRRNIPGFKSDHEVAVVMGRTKHNRIFQSLLGEDHDGIVTIEGGRVNGMKKFDVINSEHTLIMNHKEARQHIVDHLSSGSKD